MDGTFTMTFRGQVTPTFNSTGDTTGTALQAFLETNLFGAGNVVVTRAGANLPYTITFAGALAKRGLPLLTATAIGATLAQPLETTIGGGTIINAIVGGRGQDAIAVGANGALGLGGLTIRGAVAAGGTDATLRTNDNSIVLPNAVDIVSGLSTASFIVFNTIAQRLQPDTTLATPTFTYSNTISNHYNATGVTNAHLINFASSYDVSALTPAPASAFPNATVIMSGSASVSWLGAPANTALDLGDRSGANTLNFRNFSNQVTEISGNIIDTPNTGATGIVQGTFTKQASTAVDGTGLLILSGNNTYDGLTTIAAGILRAGSNTALGASTTNVLDRLTVTRGTGAATLQLTYGGQTTQAIDISNTATDAAIQAAVQDQLSRLSSVNLQNAVNSIATSPQTSGIVTVTVNTAQVGSTTIFDIVFSGSLMGSVNNITAQTAVGAGSAASTVHVTAGGIGPTTVAANAALELVGGLTYSGEFINSIQGSGFNAIPTGALRLFDSNPGSGETTSWTGNIAMPTAGATIGVPAANDQLNINGTSVISGAFTLTKYGQGTLELGGTAPNSFGLAASSLTVNEGTVRLNKPTGVNAFSTGTVIVGDNIGNASADKLVLVGVEQIPDALALTINSSGQVSTTATTSVGDWQTVLIPAATTAGTFTITVPGFGTTAAINFRAPGNPFEPDYAGVGAGNDVQSRIEAIAGALLGNVTVTTVQYLSVAASPADFGRLYLIKFNASLGDMQMLTASGAGLTPAAATLTVTYIAQLQQETATGALTLNAGSGEAGNVSLGTGTILASGSPSVTQLATLNNTAPEQVAISGAGTLAMSAPTSVAAVTYTVTVPQFAFNASTDSPELLISTNMVSGAAPGSLGTALLTKAGRGILNITGTASYTGATTINAQGGSIILSGASGALSATTSITVNQEGTLKLDNFTDPNSTRINNTAGIILTGGNLWFVGNAGTGIVELLGALTISANPNSFAASIRADYFGAAQALEFASMAVAAGNFNLLSNSTFVVGTNEVRVTGAVGTGAVGGIFTYGLVITNLGLVNEQVDLMADLDGGGNTSFGALPSASYTQAGNAGGNILIDNNNTGLLITANFNALLFRGTGLTATLSGGVAITIGSGVIVNQGDNNTLDAQTPATDLLAYGGTAPMFYTYGADEAQTLTFNGGAAGSFTLTLPMTTATVPAPTTGATQVTPTTPQTTAPLNIAGLTAAMVQQALESLPAIGLGNVVVTGTVALGFTITFIGALGGANLPALLANLGGLTAGSVSVGGTDGGGNLTISAAMTGTGGARKERKGRLTLSGNNQTGAGFTGAITVNEGELEARSANAFGTTAGGVTVQQGAALRYNLAAATTVAAEPLTINGAGFLNNNTGALRNVGAGAITTAGNITVASINTVIGVDAGDLIQNGTGVFGFGTSLNMIKVGGGTFELGGTLANTVTTSGSVFVNAGTLRLNKTAAVNAIPATVTLTIGDNDGGVSADKIVYAATASTDQINTGAITINRSGQLHYADRTDTVGTLAVIDGNISAAASGNLTTSGLTMTGGSVTLSTGTLTLTGGVTVNAFGGQAQISGGTLSLGNAVRTFTVANTENLGDLVISADITSATGGAIAATGAGATILSGSNSVLGTNEAPTISFTGTPNGGTYRLAFGGQTTGDITFDGTTPANNTAAILAALTGLSTIGPGNVGVSTPVSVNGPYTITFQGFLAGTDVPSLQVAIDNTLTSAVGLQPTVSIGAGTAGVNAYQLNTTAGVLGIGSANALGSAGFGRGLALGIANAEIWAYGANRIIDNPLVIGATFTAGARRDSAATGNTNLFAGVDGNGFNDPYDLTFGSNSHSLLNVSAQINVQDPNTLVTFSGSIGENVPNLQTAGLNLTKAGIGTLFLGGDNRFTGSTTVSAGKLDITSNNAVGADRNEVQRVQITIAGTFGLTFTAPAALGGQAASTGVVLNDTLTQAQVQTALNALASIGGVGGSVVVTKVANPGVPGTTNFFIEFQGSLAGTDVGALVVQAGTATVNINENVKGNTNVLATGGVTVSTGAALIVDGNLTIGNKVLNLGTGSLQGSGFIGELEAFGKGHGTIIATNGSSTWGTGETPMQLNGANAQLVSLSAAAGRTLTLNGTIGQQAANMGIAKVGDGTVVLAGNAPNTFGANPGSGAAFAQQISIVNDGTLALNKTPGMPAFLGGITVGDNIGAGTDILEFRASEQLLSQTTGGFTAQTPTINASGRIQTSASFSASTTQEVLAITGGGAVTNITIAVGGPIATAPAAVSNIQGAAVLQAALNAPGVLAAGIAGVRVVGGFGANTAGETYFIIFNTTTDQALMTLTAGGTANAMINAGLTARETVAGLSLQIGYDTTAPATGKSASVALNAGDTLHLAGNVTSNVMPGASGTLAVGGVSITGGTLALLPQAATAGAVRTFTIFDSSLANDFTITSKITDGPAALAGGITKATANSRLVLNNAAANSDYTGAVTVSAGALRLQDASGMGAVNAATNTVSATGVLELDGNLVIGAEVLNPLTGSGINSTSSASANATGITARVTGQNVAAATILGSGALRAISGNSSWSGNITITTDNTVIAVDNTASLTLSGTISFGAATNINTLKAGRGQLTISGGTNNTATATDGLVINQGTVELNKTGATALPTTLNVYVGDGIGGNDQDVLQYNAAAGADQIGNASVVTLLSSGRLNMNGVNDTIGTVTLGSDSAGAGDISTGAGALTIGASVTTIGQAGANATPTITAASGSLNLSGPTTFNVRDGGNATDLRITAPILGAQTLLLAFPGTTEFNDATATANTFTTTTLNEGTLILNRLNALALPNNVIVGDNIGGGSSAVLRYGASAGGNQIADAATLTVNSDGLVDLATNNIADVINGLITVQDAPSYSAQIAAGSNPLTLGGNITLANPLAGQNYVPTSPPATISGAMTLSAGLHTITVSDSIATEDLLIAADMGGPGAAVTIIGAGAANNGRLILTGNSSYSGATIINNFETVLRASGRLSGTSGITISTLAPLPTTSTVTLTLDNTANNNSDRINDAATLTMTSNALAAPAVFSFIGNSGGTTETFGATTLTTGSFVVYRSATTSGGAVAVTSANLLNASNAFSSFVGVNTDLGTTANKLIFTGLGTTTLPRASVTSAGGAVSTPAIHTVASGIAAANVVTSLAAATATDIVRLTQSETINTAKTIAGLIIAGDGITVATTGGGSLNITSGSITMAGPGTASATISVPLTLGVTGTESIVQVEDGNTLTLSNTLSFAGIANTLRKRGWGTLALSGSNGLSLIGSISVEQGVLRAGSNDALGSVIQGTTVLSGATLEIAGGISLGAGGANENITVNGTGHNNTGAIRLASDATAASTIGVNGAQTAITVNSNSTIGTGSSGFGLTVNGTVVTANTLTKIGVGDLTLSGSLANTANITVAENKVNLAKIANVAVAATLTIGNDLGGDNAQQAIVTGATGQFATVVIASTGMLDLNGIDFTATGATALTMSVGTSTSADVVNTSGTLATLTMVGNITQNLPPNFTNAAGAAPPARIGADSSPNLTLNLNNANRTITMADRTSLTALSSASSVVNVGSDELRINAVIDGGGTSGALTTAISGRLVLTGGNNLTNTGTILTVAAGTIVTLRNNNALAGAATGTVSVASGGTLEIDTAALSAARTIALSVGGAGATENLAGGMTSRALGAIRVLQGNHTFAGAVTQVTAGTVFEIPNAAGTLIFTGAYNMATFGLTVTGPGTANFQNTVSATGATFLNVNGSTVRLSGANGALSGVSAIPVTVQNAGTLQLDDTGVLNGTRTGGFNLILSGGRLLYSASAGSTQTIAGTLTLAANTANVIESNWTGGTATLNFSNAAVPTFNAGTAIRFVGSGAPLGGTNVINFASPPVETNLIIPRATVLDATTGQLDLANYTQNTRLQALAAGSYTVVNTSVGWDAVTAAQNVLLTGSVNQSVAAITANAVLIRGSGITLSGNAATALTTSVLVNDATSGVNVISVPTINTGAELITTVMAGNTLDVQGTVAGTALIKAGGGNLRLSGTASAILAAPTGATQSGTTVTITTASAHNLSVGQLVTISGVGVSGYNGTYAIASVPSATTFTYTAALTSLTPSGGGTVTGANTYTGLTLVGEGQLTVVKTGALGTSAGGTTITPGGTTGSWVVVDGGGAGINVGDEPLTINGLYGVAPGGAQLQSIGGNNSWGTGITGVTLNTAAPNVQTAISVDNGNNFTLYATIGAAGGALMKVGLGDLTLGGTGASTFAASAAGAGTGALQVLEGNVNLAKGAAVAAVAGGNIVVNPGLSVNILPGLTTNLFPIAGLVAAFDNQIANGVGIRLLSSATLNLNGRATAANVAEITMQGATINTGGGVLNVNGNILVNDHANSSVIIGVLNLSNAAHNFVVADGANAVDLLVNAAITGGGATANLFVKDGLGTMALTNVNTYVGPTNINRGTLEIRNSLALGAIDPTPPVLDLVQGPTTTSNATFVAANATLRLAQPVGGANVEVAGEVLQLSASTVSTVNSGHTLESTAGSNSWLGPIQLVNGALGGVVNIDTSLGSTLKLSGQVMHLATSANTVGVLKSGSGTLELAGSVANTFLGNTVVTAGTLRLNKTACTAALGGNVIVGDLSNGSPAPATLTLLQANQIPDASAVTIGSNSTLDLTNLSDAVGPLTMQSGSASGASVTTGSGTLTLDSDVYLTIFGTGAVPGAMAGNLNLGSGVREFNVAGASVLDVSSVIAGSGGITKTGSGTLILSGANVYTGGTTIREGAVSADTLDASGGSSSLGNAASAVVLGGATSTGTLSYTGNTATYTRGFIVNAGGGEIDVVTSGETLTIATGNIVSAGLLTIGGAGDTNITSVISGAGGLTKTDTGTLTLTGANTYTGVTTIAEGTVIANTLDASGGSSSLGNAASPVILGSATTSGLLIYTGSTATYTRGFTVNAGGGEVDVATSGETLTIATGNIVTSSGLLTIGGAGDTNITSVIGAGSGGLTKTGAGTLTLTGANTYTGVTTIAEGTVSVNTLDPSGGSSSLGYASSAVILGSVGPVFLSYTGNTTTFTRGFTLGANNVEIDVTTAGETLTISSGNIVTSTGLLTIGGAGDTNITSVIGAGSGGLTKIGTGTLTLAANNTYTGPTTVSQGTLKDGITNALPTATALTVDGGTFDLAGFSQQLGSLSDGGVSTGVVTNTGASATLTDTDSGTNTFSGLISGALALTFSGVGTLRLTAANTYSGVTLVSNGTLLVDGSIVGTTFINAGGTLGGTGSTLDQFVTGTVNPGDPVGAVGAFAGRAVNFAVGGTLELQVPTDSGTPGTDYDQFNTTGSLTLGGTSTLLVDLAGMTGPGVVNSVITYPVGTLSGTFTNVIFFNDTFTVSGITVDYTSTPGAIHLIVVGAASKLGFINQPTNTVAGQFINGSSGGVQVAVQDSLGHTVTTIAPTNITLAPNFGTLNGTLTVATVNGVATFSDLSINVAASNYTLTASGAFTGDTSGTFDITPAAADHLDFGVQPSNTIAGQSITPAVTVRIEDQFGNLVTSATSNVTVAISTNPGGGTLSGTLTVAAVGGIATFNDLSINKAGTGYTLAASSSVTGATSGSFNITPAAADHLAFGVQPSNTVAGQNITPAVTVRIEDQFGNLVTSDISNVTIGIGTNPGGGTLSGTLTVAAIGGIATFSDLSINKTGTGYTLAATGSYTGATSGSFNITPAAADHLAFGVQPSNTVAGQSISPAVTVRVEDQFGNLVTGDTSNVTLGIGTNPGGGILSGTLTIAAVGGLATFSDLSIDKVGTGYTLAATGAYTGATSGTFNITPAAADHLAFSVKHQPRGDRPHRRSVRQPGNRCHVQCNNRHRHESGRRYAERHAHRGGQRRRRRLQQSVDQQEWRWLHVDRQRQRHRRDLDGLQYHTCGRRPLPRDRASAGHVRGAFQRHRERSRSIQ